LSTAISKAITVVDSVASHFDSSIGVTGRDTTVIAVVDIDTGHHHYHCYLSAVTKTLEM
jgi:hypothetical protein